VVASVNVRDGEKVSSFSPIITLTRKSPSLIRGYIHESMYKKMKVGAKVNVISQADGKKLEGEIIGLSSRIVEFPIRLRKVPEVIVYGREVIIRIPEDNALLLGEMVSISEIAAIKKLLQNDDSEENK
jgi:HlyD family secretion protein